MYNSVKESTALTVWIHRIFDTLTPIFTLHLSSWAYNNTWNDNYQILAILSGLLLVIFNQSAGVYSQWHDRTLFSGFKLVLQGWVFTWLALLTIAFVLKDSSNFSRVITVGWAVFTPILLFIYRLTILYILGYTRRNGWNITRVAIIGAGNLAAHFTQSLINHKSLGYVPIALFDDDPTKINSTILGVPIKGSIDDFLFAKKYSEQYDEIYIALPLRAEKRIKQVLNSLANSTVTVKFIPDFFSFDLLHSRITNIAGIPIVSVYDSPLNNLTNQFLKRTQDILLSIIILLLVSPILFFIALGVKATSRGPILYKQIRLGWNGESFTIYKFRSMPVETDKNEITWGTAKEKTTSKFGSFIRKTSLDELPQFFNVLIGNMSIVGPRPERDIFVEKFRKEIPRYMQKHMVKAGITGWAQIHGWRGDTSIQKRIEFDLFYIDNWSTWFDLKVIALTIIKGFIHKNAC